jgi:hypothetical protein
MQHLTTLLAAPDPEVVTAALSTLVAFVRKTHASSVRWHGSSPLNDRLAALSRGWGGKEQVTKLADLPNRAIEPAIVIAWPAVSGFHSVMELL